VYHPLEIKVAHPGLTAHATTTGCYAEPRRRPRGFEATENSWKL